MKPPAILNVSLSQPVCDWTRSRTSFVPHVLKEVVTGLLSLFNTKPDPLSVFHFHLVKLPLTIEEASVSVSNESTQVLAGKLNLANGLSVNSIRTVLSGEKQPRVEATETDTGTNPVLLSTTSFTFGAVVSNIGPVPKFHFQFTPVVGSAEKSIPSSAQPFVVYLNFAVGLSTISFTVFLDVPQPAPLAVMVYNPVSRLSKFVSCNCPLEIFNPLGPVQLKLKSPSGSTALINAVEL